MKTVLVSVPIALLLSPDLTATAKLIWMVNRLLAASGPGSPVLLEAHTGLSQPTVQKGLARTSGVSASGPCAYVPADLLTDPRLGAQAKVLYGILQTNPTPFTYLSLSKLTGISINTTKQAIKALVQSGWLETRQDNQCAPIHFTLQDPRAARCQAMEADARRRLERAPFRGEALMREYLSLLIDSDHFEDDAAPGFLVNPATGERLQLDRFYPPTVAFEFNGPQHYGATDHFTSQDAAQQRVRDYIKLAICITRGITLVVVHPEDLSLTGMQKKIGQLLPQRDLTRLDAFVGFLERNSRRYRSTAATWTIPS